MSPQILSTHTETSTAVGATSTMSSNTNNVDGISSSPIRSPPLILAFLAIGLFVGTMVFIFGWRRVQSRFTFAAVPANVSSNRSDLESQIQRVVKPKLWDLRNYVWRGGGNEKGLGAKMTWVNLMPLSLSVKAVLDPPTATASGCTEPAQHPINNFLPTISNLNPLSWWTNKRPALRQHDPDEKKSADDDGMKVTMQVAVTIVLPSPQYPIHIRNWNIDRRHEEGKDMEGKRMTDYCIGMYECSWH